MEPIQNSVTKAVTSALGERTARFMRLFAERPLGAAVELELHDSSQRPAGIENPFVITTLIAGVGGVTLTIIVILSIWILRKAAVRGQRSRSTQRSAEEGRGHTVTNTLTQISKYAGPADLPPAPNQSQLPKWPKETPV